MALEFSLGFIIAEVVKRFYWVLNYRKYGAFNVLAEATIMLRSGKRLPACRHKNEE